MEIKTAEPTFVEVINHTIILKSGRDMGVTVCESDGDAVKISTNAVTGDPQIVRFEFPSRNEVIDVAASEIALHSRVTGKRKVKPEPSDGTILKTDDNA